MKSKALEKLEEYEGGIVSGGIGGEGGEGEDVVVNEKEESVQRNKRRKTITTQL